jgi:hypothetical protein
VSEIKRWSEGGKQREREKERGVWGGEREVREKERERGRERERVCVREREIQSEREREREREREKGLPCTQRDGRAFPAEPDLQQQLAVSKSAPYGMMLSETSQIAKKSFF